MAVNGVRLARLALNTFDAKALARFYVDVLDFERVDAAGRMSLALGGVPLDLIEVDATARAYPADVPGSSPLFQHFAIVVSDMSRAMERLAASKDWTPISVGGPQRLPADTGHVNAFKFRDPDGHPLELLAFADTRGDDAASPFVRIDHTAISVVDVERSIAFYAGLGLVVVGRSFNVGPEQQRLDDVVDARVDVVALAADAGAKPHVELLGYRGPHRREEVHSTDSAETFDSANSVDTDGRDDDIAATRMIFTTPSSDPSSRLVLRDPDGHRLEVGPRG